MVSHKSHFEDLKKIQYISDVWQQRIGHCSGLPTIGQHSDRAISLFILLTYYE